MYLSQHEAMYLNCFLPGMNIQYELTVTCKRYLQLVRRAQSEVFKTCKIEIRRRIGNTKLIAHTVRTTIHRQARHLMLG